MMGIAVLGECTRARMRAMDHGDTIAKKDDISEDAGRTFIGSNCQKIIEEMVKFFAVREAIYHIVDKLDTGILVHVASIQNVASAKMSDKKDLRR